MEKWEKILTINFDSSNAHVDNDGSNVKIYNNQNNNMVYNGGTNVEINSSAGFRELDNEGSHVTINSNGSSSNWIGSNGSNVVMNLGAGNDYVGGHSAIYSSVTVNSEGGDDIINTNYGRQVIVNAGTGNDHIENLGSENTLNGGDGMDTIAINGGSNIIANAESGNDTVWCFSDSSIVTINGGDGDDEITNYAQHVTIAAGNGKDSIFNHGSNVTVNAGDDESDDEINNTGSNVTINAGLGNDLIVIHEGTNITAYGGRGNDTISIYDGSSNVEVNSGAGNDTIWCTSDCYLITINSGEGDDEIGNDASSFSIQAGNGNDKIFNGGNNMSIDAGADNDVIETSGTNVTVRGGNGDDKVNVTNNLYNSTPYIFDYSDGDGNDIVNKYVMIYLRDGAQISDMKFDGNDIIYYIGNGSIRILDGVNGDPQHPGYFYTPNESDNSNNLPANVYVNLPPLGVDYLKDKIYEQINTNLDGFLATFDDGPMKSILEDGVNSPYLGEFAPADATKIADFIKAAYKNARDTQYIRNSNDVTQEDYQQQILDKAKFLNDTANFLDNYATIMPKYAPKYLGLPSNIRGQSFGLAGSIIDGIISGGNIVVLDQDFKKRYPNAEEDAWREVLGDTPTVLNRLNLIDHAKVQAKVRDIDPDRYDKIALAAIDGISSTPSIAWGIFAGLIGVGLSVGVVATAPGTLTLFIVGTVIGTACNLVGSGVKAAYLSSVRLDEYPESNFMKTWGEQFFGVGFGGPLEKPYNNLKNWLKGKNGGESSDLAYNYVIINGVVNAISGDVANDGSLDHATLTGSDENDTLINSGDYALIEGYNGDNVIINAGDWSTITTGNGNDSVINIGDYSMLVVGEGNDTVENGGEGVTINAGNGDNVITNSGNAVVINSGNGADYIDNVGNSVQINTGAGDDDVENFGFNVTINAGDGVDYIIDFGNSNYINAGTGDDFIDVEGGYNNIISYADGEGNDTIYGYNESDIIHLIGGTVKNTVASGEDLVVNFETNNLTIKNAANLNVAYITENDVIPILKYGGNYKYTGGNRALQNYSQGEQINLASDFTGIGLDENNFYVNSSSGTLMIQNVRDKVIGYGTSDGNLVAYSFMANNGGDIDGRSLSQFEIIIGANNANNQIFAGNGGSSMWGGNGGADTLTGGDGYDEFFFAMGSGGDVIQNAGDNDVVNLLGVTLDQITAANVSEFSVNVTLADGSYLNVEGNANVGYKVEGKIYACNHLTGEWYEK